MAAYLVEDTFTDDDAVTLPNHTPDVDAEGGGWVAGNGTWDILGNQASQDSGAAGVNSAWINAGIADCIIECDVLTGGAADYSGLVARASAANDALEVYFQATGDDVWLFKNVAGVRSQIATATVVLEASTTYAVKITLNGTSIKVEIDGTEYIDAIDAHNQTDTAHGLFQWNGVATPRWDTFRVSAL